LLEVHDLTVNFAGARGKVRAVAGVSFDLASGETLGLVGESGCGKTVTAMSILRLLPMPPAEVTGEIRFRGEDLGRCPDSRMRHIRGDRIAMVFQEPMTALNPVFTIGEQVAEALRLHRGLSSQEAWREAASALARVGFPDASRRLWHYPHQLSGGLRQRALMAMALACDPELLIADEPTTALDVTIQAQILDLMLQLRQDYDTAIMMITHDLGVIAEIAQRVIVMYAGKVVEEAKAIAIFEDPKHPYTQGLLQSIPKLGQRSIQGRQRLKEISGIVPSLYELAPGCHFSPRCPHAMQICSKNPPQMIDLGDGHLVRCFLY
jgi:peptide/nickel transport system ATP-binding protein/oligopeptide transport system ATP-binding protein